MKVTIDISKPLCRGKRISLSQGEQSWVSFKYERLPNICYWCGCLNHVDRDCDLWIESEGKLTKENQAYGAWIRATFFGKGRSSVLKVSGFYAAKKAQKKQVVSDDSVVVMLVVQAEDQPPVAVLVQTEEGGTSQEALNAKTFVSGGADLNSVVVVMESCDSGKSFEDKLGEIDKELARFDKGSGVIEGASIEGKYEENKEASIARRAEFIQGAVESVEARVVEEMVTTQAREEEGNLVSVPITQSALCDISNVIGSRKTSARVEKVKRIRKKYSARLVENVIPGVVKKNAKRLASEGDHSELPNKKKVGFTLWSGT